jgi:hypothetical protein
MTRARARRRIPFEFVLDALTAVPYRTNPMFGCTAVYVDGKIVFILREKEDAVDDNGVWVATTVAHHDSLRRDLPSLRSIRVLGNGVTGWQNLPTAAATFESEAMRACELVLARDPRIGKVPARKKRPAAARKRRRG